MPAPWRHALGRRQHYRHPLSSDPRSLVHYYVSGGSGSDANDGASAASAFATLGAALTALGTTPGTIHVVAPQADVLPSFVDISSDVDVLITGDGTPWYIDRLYTETSGWTSVGGGVYSRSRPSPDRVWNATDLTAGFWTPLAENTSTPTTPGEGEFGYDAGTLYVRMPGDADPNAKTLKVGRGGRLIEQSAGKVELRDAVLQAGNNGAYVMTGGELVAVDCDFGYSGSSGQGGSNYTATFTRCRFFDNANDGVSANGTAEVRGYDCESMRNGDEGFSAHDTATLRLWSCDAHHNAHAGVNSIDQASQYLYECTARSNGTAGGSGQQIAGIAYVADVGGECHDCVCSDNAGAGFYCATTDPPDVRGVVSGVAEGNGAADVLC